MMTYPPFATLAILSLLRTTSAYWYQHGHSLSRFSSFVVHPRKSPLRSRCASWATSLRPLTPANYCTAPRRNTKISSRQPLSALPDDTLQHPPMNHTTTTTAVRILALHGKGGDGASFVESALGPLRSALQRRVDEQCLNEKDSIAGGVRFEFSEPLTAPFALELEGGGGVGTNGYSWWTLPPGVRSYNAKKYEGFESSLSTVMTSVFSQSDVDGKDICNYDVILGHSQGAILLAALLATENRFLEPSSAVPLGYMLNGVAWPNPFDQYLGSLAQKIDGSPTELPKILFVMGGRDKINPIESATKVFDAYSTAGFDASIVNHDGGHSVPMGQDEDSQRALEDMVDWLFQIAGQKQRQCL